MFLRLVGVRSTEQAGVKGVKRPVPLPWMEGPF